jgi:two-component system sensor histidine kinase/response regulator
MLETSQQNKPSHDIEQQHAKTVLIVDDEPVIRDLCSKALTGYRVLQASNGEEALSIFQKGEIDVILTDVMMPGIGGIELLKRLKEIEPTLVVIVMTGFAEKDVILNALKADADDFITKPLNLLQLKTAVDKALVKKALKEEIANLKRMDRFKSNFLSMISHKFRTPITAISLFLQNLANGVYDPEDPTYRKYVRLTYEEACYLERLVGDLLAFSRAMDDGGGLNLEPCNPVDIVEQLLQITKTTANKPAVTIRLIHEPLPPVLLDGDKFAFAVKQIVENAFKFSGDAGTIAVALKVCEGAFQVIVEDDGIGISREDLPKIFEKFYQVDSAHSGQIHGFGLGLCYAREFVKLHGGTIAVESELGKGARFTVAIPLRLA